MYLEVQHSCFIYLHIVCLDPYEYQIVYSEGSSKRILQEH